LSREKCVGDRDPGVDLWGAARGSSKKEEETRRVTEEGGGNQRMKKTKNLSGEEKSTHPCGSGNPLGGGDKGG